MIDFYTYGFPSCWMVSIMLEECCTDYVCHTVDVTQFEQNTPEFERISPNHTVPAILDRNGPGGKPIRIFESAAILHYLANKTGKLKGNTEIVEVEAYEWMMVVITGLAPFYKLGIEKSTLNESDKVLNIRKSQIEKTLKRYVSVLDFRLREYQYLAKVYTMADVAAYPWICNLEQNFDIYLHDFVGVNNWYSRLKKRTAIRSGMSVP